MDLGKDGVLLGMAGQADDSTCLCLPYKAAKGVVSFLARLMWMCTQACMRVKVHMCICRCLLIIHGNFFSPSEMLYFA